MSGVSRITDAHAAAIRKLYEQGARPREIAHMTQLTPQTIHNTLNRDPDFVPMRKRSNRHYARPRPKQ